MTANDPRLRLASNQDKPRFDPAALNLYLNGELSTHQMATLDREDLRRLRASGLHLLQAGFVDRAEILVEFLLNVGDSEPTVFLMAALIAAHRNQIDRAVRLVELCLEGEGDGSFERTVRAYAAELQRRAAVAAVCDTIAR